MNSIINPPDSVLGARKPVFHYHGDIVRRLFIFGGIIMLAALPLFTRFLPTTPAVSLLFILLVGLLASFTSPLQKFVIVLNTLIAIGATAVFEYYAVLAFRSAQGDWYLRLLFATNQLLAIIFFLALYYSGKTWRGLSNK